MATTLRWWTPCFVLVRQKMDRTILSMLLVHRNVCCHSPWISGILDSRICLVESGRRTLSNDIVCITTGSISLSLNTMFCWTFREIRPLCYIVSSLGLLLPNSTTTACCGLGRMNEVIFRLAWCRLTLSYCREWSGDRRMNLHRWPLTWAMYHIGSVRII